MSETQIGAGQVLGSATAIGGGLAVLPLTGGSFLFMILPLVAVACGLTVLVTLALTHVLEEKN